MTEKEFSRVIFVASLVCGLIFWLGSESLRVGLVAAGAALIVLSIAARLVIEAAVVVPKVHYGVVLRWGQKRTGRIILDTDGLCWVWPFIDKVEFFNYQQDPKLIDFGFFSKDRLEIIGKALVQWRPDWKSKTLEGNNKFMENKKETIESGISETIKSVIGNIIGSLEALKFIEMKSAVERYISCILQLEVPPHVCPREVSDKCSLGSEEIMGVEKRLEFYKEHSGEINKKLREANARDSHSETEKRYGIDIILFNIGKVDFSDKTKASLERQKQAEADMAGARERRKGVSEAIHEFSIASPELDPETTLNAALVVTSQAKKDIHSVEGFKNLFKSADGKLILPEFLKGGKK